MGLTVTTPPAEEPVTLDEIKAYARVDFHDEDALLTGLGVSAREYVEQALGRQLVTAAYLWTARTFPCGRFELLRPPLQAVDLVRYRQPDGTHVTLVANADYLVDATSDPGTIEPVTRWPVTGAFPDAVEITFTAGYGAPADVPERARLAIKALAAHWFNAREPVVIGATAVEVPIHVTRLIHSAKLWVAP